MIDVPVVGIEVLKIRAGALEWALDVIKYLDANKLPDEKWEVRKVKNWAAGFIMIDGILYRRDYSTTFLRHVSLEEAQYILDGIHEEGCENHSGGRALARKVLRVGYYWPHAFKDVD